MGQAERLNPQGRHTQVVMPADVRDRFGRTLAVGDVVIAPAPANLVWRVEDVRPELAPHVPANTVVLEMKAHLRILVRAHEVAQDVVRVKSAEEAGLPKVEPKTFPSAPPESWWKQTWKRFWREERS